MGWVMIVFVSFDYIEGEEKRVARENLVNFYCCNNNQKKKKNNSKVFEGVNLI